MCFTGLSGLWGRKTRCQTGEGKEGEIPMTTEMWEKDKTRSSAKSLEITRKMGNVRRVCKGYTPTWILWQTEIDKTGIEIGKTPPWEGLERSQRKRSWKRGHSTSSHCDCSRMHTNTHSVRKQDTSLIGFGTQLVKTIEAVKYCRSRCSHDVQLKPTDHMHPDTQQSKRLNHKEGCLPHISVSCSHRKGELTHRTTRPRMREH